MLPRNTSMFATILSGMHRGWLNRPQVYRHKRHNSRLAHQVHCLRQTRTILSYVDGNNELMYIGDAGLWGNVEVTVRNLWRWNNASLRHATAICVTLWEPGMQVFINFTVLLPPESATRVFGSIIEHVDVHTNAIPFHADGSAGDLSLE